MADFLSELKVRITGESSQLKSALDKANGAAQKVGFGMNAIFSATNQVIANVVNSVQALALSFPKLGVEFESQMTLISTLTTQSRGEIQQMGQDVLAMGAKFGQATDRMTKGLYDIVGSGIELRDSMQFLEVASRNAIAGATDTATAIDALTSIVNAYQDMLGKANNQAERAAVASDILFKTVFYGKMTMNDLAGGIGRIASVSSQVGVSLEETGAALATLTAVGIKSDEAITAVRQAFISVLSPTQDAAEYAKKIGLDFSTAALKAKGLQGFLKDVEIATKGDSEALAKLFPNVRALAGVMALAGKSADRYKEILGGVTQSAGATSQAFAKMEETAAQKLARAKQTISNLGTAISQEVVTALADLIEKSGAAEGGISAIAKVAATTREIIMRLAQGWLYAKAVVLDFVARGVTVFNYLRQVWEAGVAIMAEAWHRVTIALQLGLLEIIRAAATAMRAIAETTGQGMEIVNFLENYATTLSGDIRVAEYEHQKAQEEAARSYAENVREGKKYVKGLQIQAEAARNQIVAIEESIGAREREAKAASIAQAKMAAWQKAGGEQQNVFAPSWQLAGLDALLKAEEKERAKSGDKMDKAQQQYQAQRLEEEKKGLAKQREAQFAAEQATRKAIKETTKYFEEQFQRRTEKLKSSISDQIGKLEDLRKKWLEIDRAQRGQAEGYQERLAQIVSAGLSEEGKAIQQLGLAGMFEKQAKEAGGKKDFEEQLRLLEKAQGIYASVAEQTGDESAFAAFVQSQERITTAFEAQKTANKQAQQEASKQITDLKMELSTLFLEAEKRLEIKVDTMEAKDKIAELREQLRKMRDPLEEEGFLAPTAQVQSARQQATISGFAKAATAGTPALAASSVIINITQKVDRETVRNVIIPEIKRARRQSIAVADEDEEEE